MSILTPPSLRLLSLLSLPLSLLTSDAILNLHCLPPPLLHTVLRVLTLDLPQRPVHSHQHQCLWPHPHISTVLDMVEGINEECMHRGAWAPQSQGSGRARAPESVNLGGGRGGGAPWRVSIWGVDVGGGGGYRIYSINGHNIQSCWRGTSSGN
eukprot:352960-Rhodomonas_salina.1